MTARTINDYRLLPGAKAEAFCNPCDKPHTAIYPAGLDASVYFVNCPFCRRDTAEIVDVVEEGRAP